jgi:hypothetical protein
MYDLELDWSKKGERDGLLRVPFARGARADPVWGKAFAVEVTGETLAVGWDPDALLVEGVEGPIDELKAALDEFVGAVNRRANDDVGRADQEARNTLDPGRRFDSK